MNVKESRVIVKLSQSKLARLSGVSRFKIVSYELGEGNLSPSEIELIRDALYSEAARIRMSLVDLELSA